MTATHLAGFILRYFSRTITPYVPSSCVVIRLIIAVAHRVITAGRQRVVERMVRGRGIASTHSKPTVPTTCGRHSDDIYIKNYLLYIGLISVSSIWKVRRCRSFPGRAHVRTLRIIASPSILEYKSRYLS